MLVIPRKTGESIIIDDNIILTIIEVQDDKVRLGIEHPTGVTVHRRELYESILSQENQDTGSSPLPQARS